MSKTKRMIYVREENVEFYDSLENKSDFINDALKLARLGGVNNSKIEELPEPKAVLPGLEVHQALEAMKERDRRLLAEYRERNGIKPPAGV